MKKRQTKRAGRKALTVFLAAALAGQAGCAFPAYAYGSWARGGGPAGEEEAAEYSDADMARFQDNTLEYDEIPDLVHLYNSDIRRLWDDYNEQKGNSADIQTELLSQARIMKDLKEEAQKEGDAEDAAYYASQEQSYKAMASQYTDIMEDYEKPDSTKSLSVSERQMTQSAQSLMISYNTMRLERDNQAKKKEVYEAKYQLAQAEAQAGTATALDVQAAKNQLLGAESALLSLDSSLQTVKSSLCVMTGWTADADPVIGEIPEADLTVIDSYDLASDTVKAIGNNRTLISQRTESYEKSTSGISAHLGIVDQGEQQLTIQMQSMYDDMIAKRNAYESANAGFQSASMAKNVADQKYSLGMLSQSEYLEAQLEYLQKKSARDTANINLCKAVTDYEWAVQGFVQVET